MLLIQTKLFKILSISLNCASRGYCQHLHELHLKSGRVHCICNRPQQYCWNGMIWLRLLRYKNTNNTERPNIVCTQKMATRGEFRVSLWTCLSKEVIMHVGSSTYLLKRSDNAQSILQQVIILSTSFNTPLQCVTSTFPGFLT